MATSVPAPRSILRGHKAAVHVAEFIRHNQRLATGDAEGYVVLWDLAILRPRAVWRAHESAILSIQAWGSDKIITHGRDHKLIVWKLAVADEDGLSTVLPLEETPDPRPQPWMLHHLPVNTMNFCSFAACRSSAPDSAAGIEGASEILIAVPNTLASEAIDIYSLPDQSRIHTIKPGKGNGMAMSLFLMHLKGSLTLIAAFEDGVASVHRLDADGTWIMTYRTQAHAQPILSLDVHPSYEYFITSSADSIIAKHPIPTVQQELGIQLDPANRIIEEIDDPTDFQPSLLSAGLKGQSGSRSAPTSTWKEWEHPLKVINTKHSGQQSLRVRSDGRIFATAGWDSKARVYSAKTMKELAVLEWHKVGCYGLALAEIVSGDTAQVQPASGSQSNDADDASQAATTNELAVQELQTSVKTRRINQAQTTHWIAAGAKDGKVSLWEIY